MHDLFGERGRSTRAPIEKKKQTNKHVTFTIMMNIDYQEFDERRIRVPSSSALLITLPTSSLLIL